MFGIYAYKICFHLYDAVGRFVLARYQILCIQNAPVRIIYSFRTYRGVLRILKVRKRVYYVKIPYYRKVVPYNACGVFFNFFMLTVRRNIFKIGNGDPDFFLSLRHKYLYRLLHANLRDIKLKYPLKRRQI